MDLRIGYMKPWIISDSKLLDKHSIDNEVNQYLIQSGVDLDETWPPYGETMSIAFKNHPNGVDGKKVVTDLFISMQSD